MPKHNINYSKYIDPHWKSVKKAHKMAKRRLDSESYSDVLWAAISRDYIQLGMPPSQWAKGLLIEIMAGNMWRFKPIQHYFLEPGIMQFCIDSVARCDEDYVTDMPGCMGADAYKELVTGEAKAPPNKHTVEKAFCVHFPIQERERSIMVMPDCIVPIVPDDRTKHTEVSLDRFIAIDGIQQLCIPYTSKNAYLPEDEVCDFAKLVFGLSLYMHAFPDAITAASTDDVGHLGHYTGTHTYVRADVAVSEERTISPHWRRGHYKILRHERYTHKRGQAIWVNGTFVKGATAFDVHEDAPSQERISA